MDVPHRLGRQAGTPATAVLLAALGEEGGVEQVDVLGRELVERPAAVQVDVAPVGVVGARPHPRLLDRQPPLREVLGDGELVGRDRLTHVLTTDQVRQDPFGAVPPHPRGDPPAALLAGPRVDAVVDDGVVLLALRLDGSARVGAPFRGRSERDATLRVEAVPETSVAGDDTPPPAPRASSLDLPPGSGDVHRRSLVGGARGVVARSCRRSPLTLPDSTACASCTPRRPPTFTRVRMGLVAGGQGFDGVRSRAPGSRGRWAPRLAPVGCVHAARRGCGPSTRSGTTRYLAVWMSRC